jgi:hypothetical protein
LKILFSITILSNNTQNLIIIENGHEENLQNTGCPDTGFRLMPCSRRTGIGGRQHLVC